MSVKKLGFGMMRLPLLNKDDDGSIDIELTKKMVDVFIERGFTYFDTAWARRQTSGGHPANTGPPAQCA